VENNSTWARSLPSPIPWPREAWNVPLTLAAAVGWILLYFAVPISYIALAVSFGAVDRHALTRAGFAAFPVRQELLAQLAGYVPLAAYLTAVIPALSHVSLAEIGLRRPTARDLWAGVLGAFAMLLAVQILSVAIAALTHRHTTEAAIELLRQLKSRNDKILFVGIAVVMAPVIEELTFRALVFNAFSRYMPFLRAAVLSGAVFGVIHAQSVTQLVDLSIPLAAGGMVLAYVYARTRCLWSNITSHALFNGINVFALIALHAK
jgi:hypothetical protein